MWRAPFSAARSAGAGRGSDGERLGSSESGRAAAYVILGFGPFLVVAVVCRSGFRSGMGSNLACWDRIRQFEVVAASAAAVEGAVAPQGAYVQMRPRALTTSRSCDC